MTHTEFSSCDSLCVRYHSVEYRAHMKWQQMGEQWKLYRTNTVFNIYNIFALVLDTRFVCILNVLVIAAYYWLCCDDWHLFYCRLAVLCDSCYVCMVAWTFLSRPLVLVEYFTALQQVYSETHVPTRITNRIGVVTLNTTNTIPVTRWWRWWWKLNDDYCEWMHSEMVKAFFFFNFGHSCCPLQLFKFLHFYLFVNCLLIYPFSIINTFALKRKKERNQKLNSNTDCK